MVLSQFKLDAFLFDMDGVLTTSAAAHKAAWKRTFDEVLSDLPTPGGSGRRPFTDGDYRRYVDGKPRLDGVRSFLRSRGIALPDDGDSPSPTVASIARQKEQLFEESLARGDVSAFPGSVALVQELRTKGLPTAVVSASRHCTAILKATGINQLFDVVVDGGLAEALGLAGKPAPDAFLAAARAVGVEPARAAVFEDALAGVEAGRAGGFGLVIGVDRGQNRHELREHGADIVVGDLSELLDCNAAR